MKNLFFLIFISTFIFAQKTIVGKYERISFVDFKINDLRAKIDTGAKTSSLHCSVILPLPNGEVSFILLDDEHKKFTPVYNRAKISRISKVKSSNGKVQTRYFINTTVLFKGKEYKTEFSLSDRASMNFPVLIGRSLLQNDFCVDVTLEYTD